MTHATRAVVLGLLCDWQSEMPDRRNFTGSSRSWGLSVIMEERFSWGRESAEMTFWESADDYSLTGDNIQRMIDNAWKEVLRA